MLFTEIGALRVGDLGCSSHMDEVCSMSDRRYMALEGLEDVVNPKRDLFSLGLVLYECMSKEELLEAMRYGSTSSESVRSENDLGRFGLGLKAASLSQCRKLTVVSKKDKNVSAYRWDYDFIKETFLNLTQEK